MPRSSAEGAHRDQLVGRRRELRQLADALLAAESGEPAVVIVTGDAGIGKTRLVNEVARRFASRWLVASGHCVEAGSTGLPYAPLYGVLGTIAATPHAAQSLDDAASASPGLLSLVGVQTGDTPTDTTSGLAQLRLFDSLVRLFVRLSTYRPTLILIEDLHLADQSTRAFVSFLCRNLMPKPLAVLVTARTDQLDRTHPLRTLLAELARLPSATSIEMGPLDVAEVGELLTAQQGTPAPRDVVRGIARRSGGNPFFAEQLWAVGAGQPETRPPIQLADVLLHRVDQLSAEAQHLLRVASLSAHRIERDLLLAVADRHTPSVTAALRECADARLLEPDDDGFRFRDALLAEVIANDIVPTERRALHARFAAALAGSAPPAVVARHCLGAEDLSGAFAWSVDAAMEASAIAAPDDALAHWDRVIELWPHATHADRARAGSRSTAAREASGAAYHAGEIGRAAELAQLAVDEAETRRERTLGRLTLAPLLTPLVTGSRTEEVTVAEAAIADAGDDRELATRGRFILARAHLLAGRFVDAIPIAEAVAADSRELNLADLALGARATAFLAKCQLGDVDPAEEAALAEAALASTDVETGLWVLTRLADRWWPIGPAKAEHAAAAAYDYAVEHGVRSSIRGIWARETLVLCRWLNGNWDGIEELAGTEPLAINDATAGTVALESQVDIARGNTERARRSLALAAKVTTDALSRAFIADAMVALALAERDPAAAVAICVESLAGLPPQSGFADFETLLVARGLGALADAGDDGIEIEDPTVLRAAADRAEQRALEAPSPRLTANPLSLLRAHLGRLDGGDPALWLAAIDLRAERPYELAECRFYLAKALVAAGDAQGASAQLRAAAEACSALGDVVLARRVGEFTATLP